MLRLLNTRASTQLTSNLLKTGQIVSNKEFKIIIKN
jgi:hypothetical protein